VGKELKGDADITRRDNAAPDLTEVLDHGWTKGPRVE